MEPGEEEARGHMALRRDVPAPRALRQTTHGGQVSRRGGNCMVFVFPCALVLHNRWTHNAEGAVGYGRGVPA